jgi:hypothetical protein
MDSLYAWTMAICLAIGQQTQCDRDKRWWITSTELFHSSGECMAALQEHIRRLNARPGWNGRVLLDSYLCGWGVHNPDPLFDLREENLSWPLNHFNTAHPRT